MGTRGCRSLKPMIRAYPPSLAGAGNHDKKKMERRGGEQATKTARESRERKMALLEDVDKLKRKLRLEENVHRALERAFTRPLGVLPRFPPYLPPQTLELLAEVAVLEEEVVRLEEQVVIFRKEVAWRNIETSSSDVVSFTKTVKPETLEFCSTVQPALARTASIKKLLDNDRQSQGSYSPANVKQDSKKPKCSPGIASDKLGKENRSMMSFKDKSSPNTKQLRIPTRKNLAEKDSNHSQRQVERRSDYHDVAKQSSSSSPDEKLSFADSNANKTSEEVLSCLTSIFIRLNTSKQKAFDAGPHLHVCAIDAGSFDLSRSSNEKFLLQRLKILLGKLEMVNIKGLTHQQKLALWINVYNSCMMNAFLEYGVPKSSDMVAELMQKATVNVGGHLLNAITIEHFILRLPYHLKYTCPKVARSDEMKAYSEFALEWSEPLVTFALSCGSLSSPAVRVYTAAGVERELEHAKKDYLQAKVGISETNKLKIPKLMTWYLPDFAKDLESLVDWICLQLPDDLRKAAVDCLKSRIQEPISEYVQITPYDFSFCFLLNR